MFGALRQGWKEARAHAVLSSVVKERLRFFAETKEASGLDTDFLNALFLHTPVIRDPKRFGDLHGEVLALLGMMNYVTRAHDERNRDVYISCIPLLFQIIASELVGKLTSQAEIILNMCIREISPVVNEHMFEAEFLSRQFGLKIGMK